MKARMRWIVVAAIAVGSVTTAAVVGDSGGGLDQPLQLRVTKQQIEGTRP